MATFPGPSTPVWGDKPLIFRPPRLHSLTGCSLGEILPALSAHSKWLLGIFETSQKAMVKTKHLHF